MLTQLLVPAVFALGCCSKPLEARADEFTLYAYGEGIGGVGVGYKDGMFLWN